jgi:hypothetical protein
MIKGSMQYIQDFGLGWGLILGIAIMVIVVGIYARIRKNKHA